MLSDVGKLSFQHGFVLFIIFVVSIISAYCQVIWGGLDLPGLTNTGRGESYMRG